MLQTFWKWYNRNYLLNLSIATFLFTLQLIHLYWLTVNVVFIEFFNFSNLYWHLNSFWQAVILLVDYTEIPALITTSLVYINEYRHKRNNKSLLYLAFLNSQWLHIFWITDEFVVDQLRGTVTATVLPFWLAIVAIGIDYLELPVIFDTFKKLIKAVKDRNLKEASEAFND